MNTLQRWYLFLPCHIHIYHPGQATIVQLPGTFFHNTLKNLHTGTEEEVSSQICSYYPHRQQHTWHGIPRVLLLCHCHCHCCRDKYYDSSLRTIFISLCILMSYFTKVDDRMDGLSDPVQLQGTSYIVGCKYSDWLNSHPPRDLLKFMRCKFLLKYYKTQSNLHKSFRSLGTGIYTIHGLLRGSLSFFLSLTHSPYLSPCTNC